DKQGGTKDRRVVGVHLPRCRQPQLRIPHMITSSAAATSVSSAEGTRSVAKAASCEIAKAPARVFAGAFCAPTPAGALRRARGCACLFKQLHRDLVVPRTEIGRGARGQGVGSHRPTGCAKQSNDG